MCDYNLGSWWGCTLAHTVGQNRSVRGKWDGRRGGKGVRGNHSHLSEQLSWFSVCGPAAPVVLHTLMILCLLSPLLGMMVFIDYLCVTDPGGCCVFFLFFFGCCFFDHLASSGEFYRPIGKVWNTQSRPSSALLQVKIMNGQAGAGVILE